MKQSTILQFLMAGALSRQQLAALTGYGINSICSLLDSLETQEIIERTGEFDVQQWPDGGITKRETFRIRRIGG